MTALTPTVVSVDSRAENATIGDLNCFDKKISLINLYEHIS